MELNFSVDIGSVLISCVINEDAGCTDIEGGGPVNVESSFVNDNFVFVVEEVTVDEVVLVPDLCVLSDLGLKFTWLVESVLSIE